VIDLFLDTLVVVAGALCGLFVALLVIAVSFCVLTGASYMLWLICGWIAERWSK
jgi:hypothetical protein